MLITIKKQLRIYVTQDGKKPLVEWLESIKDNAVRYRIKTRLDRVTLGNLGEHKFIGSGVYELRLSFGSGYRIYYANEGENIILLLCGGDKSTQQQDVKKANKNPRGKPREINLIILKIIWRDKAWLLKKALAIKII